jgi:hypothetical protein
MFEYFNIQLFAYIENSITEELRVVKQVEDGGAMIGDGVETRRWSFWDTVAEQQRAWVRW